MPCLFACRAKTATDTKIEIGATTKQKHHEKKAKELAL